MFHPVHTEATVLPFENNTSGIASEIQNTPTSLIHISGDKAIEKKLPSQIKSNKSDTRFGFLKTKQINSVI